jgi:ABC-2 type transport system permease protein
MIGVWVLLKKELRDIFLSPLVYVLGGIFIALSGWLFYNNLLVSQKMTVTSLTNGVLIPTLSNMNFIFLLLSPLLTMGLFSEERKNGTLNLLYRSTLSEGQILAAKYFTSVIMALFILSLTIIFPIILAVSGYTDWIIVFSAYAGLLFSIMCYLAVGVFASTLTDNQIVAAITSFGMLMALTFIVFTANVTDNYLVGTIFRYFSTFFHFDGFLRGTIKSFNFVYFISFIGFFSFLSHKSLQSRNW